MSAPRKFDHDEAKRLRAAGHSIRATARALGVSPSAIRMATEPNFAKRLDERARRWQHQGRCIACGGPATRLNLDDVRYCRPCWFLTRRLEPMAERECTMCGETRPISDFGTARRKDGSRYPRAECRDCETARRYANRALNLDRSRAYDREYHQRRRAEA